MRLSAVYSSIDLNVRSGLPTSLDRLSIANARVEMADPEAVGRVRRAGRCMHHMQMC